MKLILRRKIWISRAMLCILMIILPIKGVWAADSPQAKLPPESLISALRKGGYSIYFRHEATNWSQSDKFSKYEDWLSCDGSKVRLLSAVGRQNAQATGHAIRALGVPVGEVLASPYCRTMETASLMNLGEVKPSIDVINMRVTDYFGGSSAVIASAQALLARPPEPDTNRVIVAHGNVANSATPVYPEEGEAVIFKSDGDGGFRFIGRLTPSQWQILAAKLKL